MKMFNFVLTGLILSASLARADVTECLIDKTSLVTFDKCEIVKNEDGKITKYLVKYPKYKYGNTKYVIDSGPNNESAPFVCGKLGLGEAVSVPFSQRNISFLLTDDFQGEHYDDGNLPAIQFNSEGNPSLREPYTNSGHLTSVVCQPSQTN